MTAAPVTVQPERERAIQLGMVLFLVSEVMFFAALFATYFTLKSTTIGAWPPKDADMEILLPGIATLILLISSATFTIGEHRLLAGNVRQFVLLTLLTIVLGFVFLGIKIWELVAANGYPSTNAYWSVWWTMLSLHGVHLFIGCVLLAVLIGRAWQGAFSAETLHANGVQAVGYYWHFVDVVWVLMFVVIWIVR